MSAVGAWLARAFASLGGPQTAVVVLVAGVVAGGLGGYAISNSQRAGSTNPSGIPVYPCPDQGPALLTVAGGQQLLVTGRLADSSWLRIHLPEPGRTEGWVKAGPLTVSGSVDSLPVVSCAAEAAAPSPAVAPQESLTAIVNATPSPGPTPTPSPTPSPTTNAAPTLSSLTASTKTVSYDQGSYCPNAVKQVTFSVKVSDVSGIASVALNWRAPGASTFTPAPMTLTAGTATSGTWQATLDTTANGLTTAGNLNYFAYATDTAGATAQLPSPGSKIVTVAICTNTGPSISGATSSSGSTLYSDPSGHGGCQTATDITAAVTDVDGLKSVTLFFRRPGSSSWSSKAMDNQTVPGKWYANLDTRGDKISTGTLSWYIKAVDKKNAAGQTKAVAMRILPCGIVITSFTVQPSTVGYLAIGTVCTNNSVLATLNATDAGSTLPSFATLSAIDPQGALHSWGMKGSGTYQASLQAGQRLAIGLPGTWQFWAVLTDATGQSVKSATRSIDVSPGYCK